MAYVCVVCKCEGVDIGPICDFRGQRVVVGIFFDFSWLVALRLALSQNEMPLGLAKLAVHPLSLGL